MLRKLVALCLLLLPLGAYSQPFTVVFDKLWGGVLKDSFMSCAVAPDGSSYVAVSATVTSTSVRSRVIKYTAAGAVAWSKDMPIGGRPIRMEVKLGPLGLYCLASVLRGGQQRSFVCRIDEATGNVVWVQDEVRYHLSDLAVNSSIVSYAREVDSTGRVAIKTYLASNGTPFWEVVLPPAEVDAELRMTPDRELIVMTSDTASGETVVRKLSSGNGAERWSRRYFGNVGREVAVLSPSGNVVFMMGNERRIEVLSGSSGATLRVDVLINDRVPQIVVPSVDDSYFVHGSDLVFPRTHLFDRNGYAIAIPLVGFTSRRAVDSMGGLYLAFQDRTPGSSISDLFANTIDRSQKIPSAFSTKPNDIDASGPFVLVCGDSEITSTNTKGRVVLLRPEFAPLPASFAYRKGQVLSVGAPGFMGISAGMVGSTSALAIGPARGLVNLSPNGRFTYTPTVGTHDPDQFTVQYRSGSQVIRKIVGLVPLKPTSVSTTISGQPVSSVIGGVRVDGRANLSTGNPFNNLVVQFSDTIQGLVVTSSRRVGMNSTLVDFNVITSPVDEDQTGQILATLDGVSVSTPFTVKRALPSSLSFTPSTVGGLEPFAGRVTMNGKAPPSGYEVVLSQTGSGLSIPTRVTVPANANQVEFQGTANPVVGTTVRTVTATSGGRSVAAQITVQPGQPFTLTLNPTTVRAGEPANGKIELTQAAGSGGASFAVSANGNGISVPSSVTVASGTSFKNFTMTTSLSAVTRVRTITASSGVISRTATLTILPGDAFSLTITPTVVQGGTTASGRVQLGGASVTNTVFTMTKDGGSVSVPGTVTVPAGALQKTFSMPTAAVTTTIVRTITATNAGVSRAQTLTLTP